MILRIPSWLPPPTDRAAVGTAVGMVAGISIAAAQAASAPSAPAVTVSLPVAIAWIVAAVGAATPLLAKAYEIFRRASNGGGGGGATQQTTVVHPDRSASREEGRDAGTMLERVTQLAAEIRTSFENAVGERAETKLAVTTLHAQMRSLADRLGAISLESEATVRSLDHVQGTVSELRTMMGDLVTVVIPAAKARLAEDRAKRRASKVRR